MQVFYLSEASCDVIDVIIVGFMLEVLKCYAMINMIKHKTQQIYKIIFGDAKEINLSQNNACLFYCWSWNFNNLQN